MTRSAARRLLLRGAGTSFVVVALASCGARTGLFAPDYDSELIIDASVDSSGNTDAGVDVLVDAPRDAPRDVIEEPPGCIPGTFPFTPATSQIMFVLDRSRSMLYRLDSNVMAEPGEISRWSALRDALDSTITPFSSQIAMGARFYPQLNASGEAPGACQQDPPNVAIIPALDNAATILRVFRDAVPVGGTPTAQALDRASLESTARRSVARAIVVATDGAPNCNRDLDPTACVCTAPVTTPGSACNAAGPGDGSNCLDDVQTVNVIREIATTRNTPVYVVGIGVTGSFATTLDAMAVAGGRPRSGTPRYYPAETTADLQDAFAVVRDSVAKCSYVTPSSPNEPDSVVVNIGGVSVPRDPSHLDGWDWIDREFGQLQLFGPACAAATATNVNGTILCEQPDAAP